MQTVLETPTFIAACKAAGVVEAELQAMIDAIAANPLAGDVIPGSGGARKLRFARQGGGKSGGYRTIHYFGGEDVPVFLLALVTKSDRGDISQAERNELRSTLPRIVEAYRKRRG